MERILVNKEFDVGQRLLKSYKKSRSNNRKKKSVIPKDLLKTLSQSQRKRIRMNDQKSFNATVIDVIKPIYNAKCQKSMAHGKRIHKYIQKKMSQCLSLGEVASHLPTVA